MFRSVLFSCLVSGLLLAKLSAPTTVTPEKEEFPSIDDVRDSIITTNSTYQLYHIKVNWFQAIPLCSMMDNKVAAFNTKAEYDRLVSIIKEKTGGHNVYWTSGTDLGQRGKFVWVSTGKLLNYTNWCPGESNPTTRGAPVRMEDCVDLRTESHNCMSVSQCYSRNYVICEEI